MSAILNSTPLPDGDAFGVYLRSKEGDKIVMKSPIIEGISLLGDAFPTCFSLAFPLTSYS